MSAQYLSILGIIFINPSFIMKEKKENGGACPTLPKNPPFAWP